MEELEKIYEAWSAVQSDHNGIINKWCEIETFLYEICSDNIREKIEDYIMEYAKILEKQSFIEGFKLAFRIWEEVCSSK